MHLPRGSGLTAVQLWCWINNDWGELRIYTYYIPIWICIFFSFMIYVAVGYHVFHQRNRLRNMTFSQSVSGKDGKSVSRSDDARDSAEKVCLRRPIAGTHHSKTCRRNPPYKYKTGR